METYTIPRGIKVREVVAYGLNGKQIIYLGFGCGGGLGLFALPLPLEVKIAGSIIVATSSLLLSLATRHGQELDKYVWNTITYQFRQKEWSIDVETEKENSIRVNFKTQQPSRA
jgi:hypothetical protein